MLKCVLPLLDKMDMIFVNHGFNFFLDYGKKQFNENVEHALLYVTLYVIRRLLWLQIHVFSAQHVPTSDHLWCLSMVDICNFLLWEDWMGHCDDNTW